MQSQDRLRSVEIPSETFTTMRMSTEAEASLYRTEKGDLVREQMSALLPGHMAAILDTALFKSRQAVSSPDDNQFHALEAYFPLLHRHVQRLQLAVEALGRSFPHHAEWPALALSAASEDSKVGSARLLAPLAHLVDQQASEQEAQRVRLAVKSDGAIVVQAIPLKGGGRPHPKSPLHTVKLDSRPTFSKGNGTPLHAPDGLEGSLPDLSHKTDARRLYKEACDRVGADYGSPVRNTASREARGAEHLRGCFDVLLWTQRDGKAYVTESSIANIIVERPTQNFSTELITPPARLGLLPGVMRQALLDSGLLREELVEVDELLASVGDPQSKLRPKPRLWLCNALRGVWEVDLVAHVPA